MAKKLYLNPWEFNKSILCDVLEEIVAKKDGELFGYYTPGIIIKTNHSTGETFGEKGTNHCDVFGSSVSFVLDGFFYSISFDDNPFFEFHFCKAPAKDGFCEGSYYYDDLDKSLLFDLDKSGYLSDYYLTNFATDDEIKAMALKLFDGLRSLPISKKYDSKRKEITKRTRSYA